MSDLVLTVFDADDETQYLEVGTSPSHTAPYLCEPENYAEAEIDIQEGRARIGRLDVDVIDPQTGATKVERWLTDLLGTPDGYSALNGRRARLAHADGTLVIDGICAGVTLHDSFAGFRLAIEDIRSRGIKVPLFNRTNTATVLPRGVLAGYGSVPGGSWLVPPVVPLTGTYGGNTLNGWVDLDGAPRNPTDEVSPELVLTPAMQRAMRVTSRFEDWVFEAVMDRVTVLWRPEGSGGAFTEVKQINVTFALGEMFGGGRVRTSDGELVDVLVARRVWLSDFAEAGILPTTGQRVELVVRYIGPASEDYPFHFEGTAGELLRNIWRGDYSTDDEGAAIDPRIRYDASRLVGSGALPALQRPVRLRITEPEPDLREFVDRICKALGVAPALNAAGEVSPVSEELPDESLVLAELNDSNTQAIPGWEHPIDSAITQVEMTYPRDYRVPASVDPNGERSAGDGLATVEQLVTIRPPDDGTLQQVVGVKTLEIDGFLWRALGGEDGQPLMASIRDEAGLQHAQRRGIEAILRYAYGGQESLIRARRSDASVAALEVGDWVLDARSWAPNYQTGERGRNHLAQVVSVRDLNPAWREIRLVDAAPHANPVAQPTLGALSEDSPGVITVPVTDVPEGGHARVDYAISATLPDNGSGLWTMAGRLLEDGELVTPELPAGATVWVRARGERVGRRASAWTNAASITLSALPAVVRAYLTLEGNQVVVLGEVNSATAGVRIYYARHRPSAEPGTLTDYQDFDATDGVWELEGVEIRSGEAITVEVEPWTGWDGAEVSGTAGTRAIRTGRRAADADSFRILAVNRIGQTGRFTVEFGAAVEDADVHAKVFALPLPEDHLAQLYDAGNLVDIVTESGGEFSIPLPAEDENTWYAVIPRAATAAGDIPVIGDAWEGHIEGGIAPVTIRVEFIENAAGTAVETRVTIDEDPRGVISGARLWETRKGVRTGPFALTRSGGVLTRTSALLPKPHVLVLEGEVTRSDGQPPIPFGPITADSDKASNVLDGIATPNGSGMADLTAIFDSDTRIGADGAEFRVNGGEVEPLEVTEALRASWQIEQSLEAGILVEVRGINQSGAPGEWFPIPVPRYVPPPITEDMPILTDVEATANALGDCVEEEPVTILISWTVLNRKLDQGYAISIWRFSADGLLDEIVADGLEPLTGTFNDDLPGWETDLVGVPTTYTYRVVLSNGLGGRWTDRVTNPVEIYLVACVP